MSYIAALDVGTTTVRCFVLNEKCEIKSCSVEQVRTVTCAVPWKFMNENLRFSCSSATHTGATVESQGGLF